MISKKIKLRGERGRGGEREKWNGANYLSKKRQEKAFSMEGKRGEMKEKE